MSADAEVTDGGLVKITFLQAIEGKVGEPICPGCKAKLSEITYPSGETYMSKDQWMAVRAGDWWCPHCPNNGRGKNGAYYWNTEILKPVKLSPGTFDIAPQEVSWDEKGLCVAGLPLEPGTYLVEDTELLLRMGLAGLRPGLSEAMAQHLRTILRQYGSVCEAMLSQHSTVRRALDLVETLEDWRGRPASAKEDAEPVDLIVIPPDGGIDWGDVAELKLELDKIARPQVRREG